MAEHRHDGLTERTLDLVSAKIKQSSLVSYEIRKFDQQLRCGSMHVLFVRFQRSFLKIILQKRDTEASLAWPHCAYELYKI
jgi:hypothetical protein